MLRLMLAAFLLTGWAGGLRADLAGAQAAYAQGLQLEKAKQYQEAIQAYEASLAAEPRYAYAHKQIGNCRYYLGDKAGALQAYDAYLAVIKNDAQTLAFAEALRRQVGAQPAPQPDAAAVVESAAAASAARRWRLGLDLGYHMLSFKDYNDDWKSVPATPGSTMPKVESGISIGLLGGFRVVPRLELGLDLDYMLVAIKVTASGSFGSITVEDVTNYNFSVLWVGPYASYELMTLPNGLSLDAGLGAGYMTLMGAGSDSKTKVSFGTASSETSSKTTYNGGAIGFKAKVGARWQAHPLFSTYLDLGYRLASVPKVNFSTTTSSGGSASGTLKRFGPNAGANPADLALDYSGMDLQLGAALRF